MIDHARRAVGFSWAILVLLAAAWLVSSAGDGGVLPALSALADSLEHFVRSLGVIGPLVFIVLYVARVYLLVPAGIMTPLSALLFGPWWGVLFSFIGGTLSAFLAFYTTRFLAGDSFRTHHRLQKYDQAIAERPFMTGIFLRLVPVFPFDVVSFGLGASSMPFRDYALTTMIGSIPGLFAYTFLGESIADPRYLVPTIAFFVLITAMTARLRPRSV
jgi:uncharacterized membrane protein YdjX (TVP38/TMEM64 family)